MYIMQQLFIYELIDFFIGADAVDVEALLTEGPVQKIILYRALLQDNLIETFKGPKILHVNLDMTFIGSNGKEEEGKGAGV